MARERYDVEGIMEAMAFLQLIKDRFPKNSVTRTEFFALLTAYCNGATTDARAVVARANELLEGHPDLANIFQAFLDPGIAAERFLDRVKQAGTNIFDDFIANLIRLKEEPELDAHAVYARFGAVFGLGNGDLLRDFAQFLPTKFDLLSCAEAKLKLKRQHAADPGVGAAKHSSRSRAEKKPAGLTPMHYTAASYDAGADVIGSSRRLSSAKKPRVHDDREPAKCNPISYAGAGAVGGSRPSRANKPPASNGENRCSAPVGDAMNGTARDAAVQDDGKKKEAVSAFRTAWEFETGYSKLVSTMARAEEELRGERVRAHVPSLEDLFPSRECRDFLAAMYGDAWGTMRMLLEGGEYRGYALKVVVDSLGAMEAAAVEAARSWQDPARAGPRLNDRVR